jgi:trk system potassium uptake protein TrkH
MKKRIFRPLLKYVGSIQCLISGLILTVLPISILYGEWYQAMFVMVSSAIIFLVGYPFHRFIDYDHELGRGQTILIAGVAWLVTALLGCLPFLLAAHWTPPGIIHSYVPAGADYTSSLLHFTHPLHAVFESMSGWTTTGLTMSVHEPSLPRTLLWYRSFMQWIGGIGFIALALAILPQPGTTEPYFLYQSEARERKVRPSVITTVKVIFWTYLGLTLFSVVWLFSGTVLFLPQYPWTEALWDAFNHAMTAQSTGGYSVLDNSTADYGSYLMEWWTVPPMILGAIALPVHFLIYARGKIKLALQDVQTRLLFSLLCLGTPVLILLLNRDMLLGEAFHRGGFQFFSALTTTGFQTGAIGDWPFVTVLFLSGGAMIIGGSAGATVGGVKIIRAYLVGRSIVWTIKKNLFSDNAVVLFDIGSETYGRNKATNMFHRATTFCMAYLLILVSATVVLLLLAPANFTPADVLFDAISAQGTVGLSSGFTGPGMHPLAEIILIVLMWIGRLEIIPVLMLVYVVLGGSMQPKNP